MELEPTTEENPLETALALRGATLKRRNRLRNAISWHFVPVCLIFAVGLAVHPIKRGKPPAVIGPMVGTTAGAVFGIFWFAFFDKERKQQIANYKSALREVTGRDDINAVGLLLKEVEQNDFALRQAVRAALIRLLSRLQAENAPVLDAKQRKILNLLPFTTGAMNPNLRLAALRAIAQIGDAESLRVAKQNRNSTGEEHQEQLDAPGLMRQKQVKIKIRKFRSSLYANTPDYISCFQSEVANCIAELEARLARETAAETLLRASQAENNPAEILLRPAANTESERADLLRPADAAESPTVPLSQKISE